MDHTELDQLPPPVDVPTAAAIPRHRPHPRLRPRQDRPLAPPRPAHRQAHPHPHGRASTADPGRGPIRWRGGPCDVGRSIHTPSATRVVPSRTGCRCAHAPRPCHSWATRRLEQPPGDIRARRRQDRQPDEGPVPDRWRAAVTGRRGSVRQADNGTWSYTVDVTPPGEERDGNCASEGSTRRAAQTALTKSAP